MAKAKNEKKNWFATIPGLLSVLAALIGLLTALYASHVSRRNTGADAPTQPNTTSQIPSIPAQNPQPTAQKPVDQTQNPPSLTKTARAPAKEPDPCRDLPFDQQPVSCLEKGDK